MNKNAIVNALKSIFALMAISAGLIMSGVESAMADHDNQAPRTETTQSAE